MKVLVTGASGFIGRHVLSRLNLNSVETVAVTRKIKNDHPEIKNGSWVEMDIARPFDHIFDTLGCPDVLIHLAWGGLPNYNCLAHFEQELVIHYSFIKQMTTQGLKHVVVAGTCLEYGMQSGSLSEQLLPQPATPYGFAKNSLRAQLEFLQASSSFTLAWARLFYLYGENQAKTSLYSQLKLAVARGDKSFDMSQGEQLRDFMKVDNAAKYFVDLALDRVNVGVINICSGLPVSVRNLVEKWISDNRWNIELNLGHYPYPAYEPMAFWGNPTKLQAFSHEYKAQEIQQ